MSRLACISLAVFISMAGSVCPVAAQQAVTIARLEASPAALELRVGETLAIEVVAYDRNGDVVDVPIRVTGPRRSVTVRGGRVTGLAAGQYEIYATAPVGPDGETVSLAVPVTVHWPAATAIEIVPDAEAFYEGTTFSLFAEVRHSDGSLRPGARVDWSTSDASVADVDRFGHVTATGVGSARIAARFEDVTARIDFNVSPLPAATLTVEGGIDQIRTGDVQTFTAVARDASGTLVADASVAWSHSFSPAEGVIATSAPGQLHGGKFVADVPGVYTVTASLGPLQARRSFEVTPREAVQKLEVTGHGRQSKVRTTDFWVFEGVDGRDYAITGAKESDGHAFVFDVTDPGNIVKTDSIQVDARSVNDVKVSPDARYATVTREGASNRRNGVVILDLANPAHPTVASTFDEGLTGGVHNAFPLEDYLFALSAGTKYLIIDVRDIYNPKYVSEYDHPNSRVHDVWVHDGIAYSAEWGTGVVAVDVGNGQWGGAIDSPVFITSYAVPSGATHAVFPYRQEETGKFYLFIGDEIMSRQGLAMEGIGGGQYRIPYNPETGSGGTPLSTQGYIQVIDFTDPEHPSMVARYEVTEYGTHNIWVQDDVLYQAYYEGGLRVVDVSGELMGNLYTQGREIAVLKPSDPIGYVANSPMVWSAMPFKGHVFLTDTNSGLWSVKIEPKERPVM